MFLYEVTVRFLARDGKELLTPQKKTVYLGTQKQLGKFLAEETCDALVCGEACMLAEGLRVEVTLSRIGRAPRYR
jgi:hypothetical protein